DLTYIWVSRTPRRYPVWVQIPEMPDPITAIFKSFCCFKSMTVTFEETEAIERYINYYAIPNKRKYCKF
ncbi:MAG: hypothetical protein MI799_03510, partial [Desulfobacterales bacterium]|nr:hypothetical protein [Desulfobacterales bacterium]